MTEIGRLQERIAELEEALGLTAQIPRALVPRKLHPQSRSGPLTMTLIGVLLTRPFADRYALFNALYGLRPDCDQPAIKSIDVYVSFARAALRHHGIELTTVWGKGWYLDAANKEKLRAVIEQLNTERAAA